MKKNNITITHPQIAAEWDYQRNGDLKPTDVTKGQTITVNWLCTLKRHPYPARVDHRCSMKSGCPYCAHKKPFPGETDLATIYPEIAAEWDYENNPDKPEDYLPASNKKKRWICPICHQSYPRKISERTLAKMGCRHCTNPGERSTSQQEQAFVFYFSMKTAVQNREKVCGYEVDIYLPELNTGIEYHGEYYHLKRTDKDEEKKSVLTAQGIRLITVKCDRERSVSDDTVTMQTKSLKTNPNDNELEWAIKEVFRLLSFVAPDISLQRDRSQIYALYIRTIKENSLAERRPDLASEWCYELNYGLTPEMFSVSSNKTVNWTCPKCKINYPMRIGNRSILGQNCPYCAGKKIKVGFNDLGTTHPKIAAEWDYDKNGDKTPQDFTAGSKEKVWWRCRMGHSWRAVIQSRTRQIRPGGCRYCAGKTRCINLDTGEIYDSCAAAARAVGVTGGAITDAIKRGGKCKEFRWGKCE